MAVLCGICLGLEPEAHQEGVDQQVLWLHEEDCQQQQEGNKDVDGNGKEGCEINNWTQL